LSATICGRDYGVYAIGLFCPDCGAPNLRLHFERERQLVNAQVEIAEAQDEGLAELAYSYQREVRIALRAKRRPRSSLQPEFLTIGSMADCAELVSAEF